MNIDLSVAITTWIRYPIRLDYFRATVESLKKNLVTEDLKVQWVVSCESERNVCESEFDSFCKDSGLEVCVKSGSPNLGSNLNFLFDQCCRGDYILYVQDDWTLDFPLLIKPDIDFLRANPYFVAVRYYAVPHSTILLPPLPNCPSLREINRNTIYFFTDNPSLRSSRYQSLLGLYSTATAPNGQDHSLGEMDMNDRVKASPYRIALKHNGLVFIHIGTISSLTEKWDSLPKMV